VPKAVEIRPLADPSAKLRPGNALLGDARAQLALGNVGLALEGFRKVLRQQPDNPEAYAGIASCYAAMGRNDLARSNYEAALAFAPQDPGLLAEVAAVAPHPAPSAVIPPRSESPVAELASRILDSVRDDVAQVRIPAPALSSVTVALPPAPPVDRLAAAGPTVTVELPPAEAISAPTAPVRAVIKAQRLAETASPRLERLSLGEVALVTTGRPIWRAQLVERTQQSTTVRWVPIQTASQRPNIRLLNAAQHRGLAAQTRQTLFDRGWRKMEIGDASAIREQSVVLYPASRRTLGRNLAAQFGFRSQPTGQGDVLIVLLGRDAARRPGNLQRG
jgi:tetratricopeptide (TPR) repeat protein